MAFQKGLNLNQTEMYIPDSSIDEMVAQICNHAQGRTCVLAVAEHTQANIQTLIQRLRKEGLTFMGGIFPKVIHDNAIHDKGIVQNTFENALEVFAVRDLHSQSYTIPGFSLTPGGAYTLLTYVDGLTSHISHYLLELYSKYGSDVNYLGGGAGSLSLKQIPCVFTQDGIFQDAAVCCLVEQDVSLAVHHGWEKIAGPFIATKTRGNVVEELNWQNAFEVYRSIVEDHSGKTFTDTNFFDISKGYPFGIVREHTESVVRDPLSVNEQGQIICVGEVEENTFLDILQGKPETLISAASTAVRESLEKTSQPQKAILIDCISRVLFLEEEFEKELGAVTGPLKEENPEISIAGALTLGEISSFGQGLIQFFNKTMVVGLF